MTANTRTRSKSSVKEEIHHQNQNQNQKSSWFQLPQPIRRVFDKFPLITLNSNQLPQRSPRFNDQNVLYIFSTIEGEIIGKPSYNPSCLKWQAFLKFNEIPFCTKSANNHASISGSLPFLLPSNINRPSSPISTNKIPKWVSSENIKIIENQEVYTSLIDHTIRNAWLYYLYLDENFDSVAWSMYIIPTSSNFFVQKAIANQLQTAAKEELLKSISIIDKDDLYQQAEEAFQSLSTLLNNKQYFGGKKPELFDASIFAYTNIILDNDFNWKQTMLIDILKRYSNLVQHRNRILEKYF